MDIKQNSTKEISIISLKFEEECYEYLRTSYVFASKNNKNTIYYSNKLVSNQTSPVITIENLDKFSATIFEIIKNWKHKYQPKEDIYDGVCWSLKLKLSNGKYVYYGGYQTYPDNYEQLKRYLNRCAKNT